MINFSQFIKGVNTTVPVAGPILEKLFGLMDSNGIGLVDFEKFSEIISIETQSQIPKPGRKLHDGFQWQEMVIGNIKDWVRNQKLTPVEAFRSFDKDFNGLITRQNMKSSLTEFLKIKNEEITETRLDRLMKLLSFYKTGGV